MSSPASPLATEDDPEEAYPYPPAPRRQSKDPPRGSLCLKRTASCALHEDEEPEEAPVRQKLKLAQDLSYGFRMVHNSIAGLSNMTGVVDSIKALKKKERVMRIEMHASERYECRLCLENAILQFSRGEITEQEYEDEVARVERRYLSGGRGMWCDFKKMVTDELSGGDAVAVLKKVQNSATLRLKSDEAKAIFHKNASDDESKIKEREAAHDGASESHSPTGSDDNAPGDESTFAEDEKENTPYDTLDGELPLKKEREDSDSEDSDASWIKPHRDTENL